MKHYKAQYYTVNILYIVDRSTHLLILNCNNELKV